MDQIPSQAVAKFLAVVVVVALVAANPVHSVAGSDGLFCGPTLEPITSISDAGSPTSGFAHPGVLVSREILGNLRSYYLNATAPWCTAQSDRYACVDGWMANTNRSHYLKPEYTPQPRAVVECGSYDNPNLGCSEEVDDAEAAYANALFWVTTQDIRYATQASKILDAWTILQNHTNDNAQLQAGMAGSPFIRAAEILMHTNVNWNATNFKAMLERAFLPLVSGGCQSFNGNWELILAEATMSLGVFFDSPILFNRSLTLWRGRVPAYLYLKEDGPVPAAPLGTNWSSAEIESKWKQKPTGPLPWPVFKSGLCQETCRDMGHVQMGLSAMMDTAETAYHQGVNLFDEQSERLTTALEFHASLLCRQQSSHDKSCQEANLPSPPKWLCGGNYTTTYKPAPMWEISYNHFHNRRGLALPATKTIVEVNRPTNYVLYMVYETLTHGQVLT